MKFFNNKTFIKVFSISLFVPLIIVFFIFFIYNFAFKSVSYDPSLQRSSDLVSKKEAQAEDDSKSKGFLTSPVRTNFLIVGVDKEEHLTDVIMAGSFISTTGQINLISIPRDTYTTLTGQNLSDLRKINKNAPNFMKINSIHSYAGKKEGVNILKNVVQDLLGINIDYYVKVNLNSFKEIVDMIGGVYFDVPKGGLKYSDPTQNLKIDLKGGYQLLNGSDAEGLVRFRKGYARQDLQRVEVQQAFIKEFIKQALNKETLLQNLGGFAITVLKYVDSNMGVSELPKYIKVIDKINPNNINSTTAPGSPKTINGASYYILDNLKLKEVVDDYFYGSTIPEQINIQETTD